MAPRKVYAREFKLDTIKAGTKQYILRNRIARDLGLDSCILRCWIQQFVADGDQAVPGSGSSGDADDGMTAKYQFMAGHASQYAVAHLCCALGLTRSGYDAWRKLAENQRSQANRLLLVEIWRIHGANGSRDVMCPLNRVKVSSFCSTMPAIITYAGTDQKAAHRVVLDPLFRNQRAGVLSTI
jgi:hypothetical protein